MPKPKHILLVEDLPVIQRAVTHIMNELDIQLSIASTGQEAIELAKTHHFDLIFMDIGLPDIPGNEVSQRIREYEQTQSKHTPIVALTANTNEEDHPTYFESGMEDVMIKPISVQKAQAIFQKLIA